MRLSQSAYPTEAARNSFVAAVLDRLRTLPGVSAAASTTNLFIPGSSLVTLLHIEGRRTADGQPHTVQFRRVSPGYFRTLAIPLEAGRDFDGRDAAAAPPVAIVSRSFADRYWPGENPIGQQIRRNAAKFTQTVVGVVGDVSDVGLSQPPEPTLYLPYTQNNPVAAPVSLVVRTSGDPLALAPAVRAAVLGLDPAQPVDNMLTLEQYLSDSLGTQRFRSTLLLTLALIGVALAAIGTYGVTARFVRERTREIGVRLALGASRSSVWMLVVGRAMRAVAAGMVTGLAVAAFASTAMLSLLPNLDRADWPASIAAVVVLLLFGLTAAALPALRAINVPPGVAIRD
jgi:putative ABC transport system permease protein